MKRHQPVLELHCPIVFACEGGVLELGTEPRRHIGSNRNAAAASMGIKTEGCTVFSGELDEFVTAQEALFRGAGEVCRCIFGADNIRTVAGQPRQSFRRDARDGASGNVVNENWYVDGISNRSEVRVNAFLSGFIVIGHDDKCCIRAGILGVARVTEGLLGAIGTGSGDDGHPSMGLLDSDLDDQLVLVFSKGRRFSCGSNRHNSRSTLPYLPINQLSERLLIYMAVGHRSNQSRDGTL